MKKFCLFVLSVQILCCVASANVSGGRRFRSLPPQCQGSPFNSGQLLSHYPGKAYGTFGSWSVTDEQTRTCNTLNGCDGWVQGNPYSPFGTKYATVAIDGYDPVSKTGKFYSAIDDKGETVDLELWTGPDQTTSYAGRITVGRWRPHESTSLAQPVWDMLVNGHFVGAGNTKFKIQMNSNCLILDVSQVTWRDRITYIEHTIQLAGQF